MSEFVVESTLHVSPGTLLGHLTMDHVNWELWPLVSMSAPRRWRELPIERWETGRVLFSSWILLAGLLPIDRHTFQLERVVAGEGFDEHSSSWVNRSWRHSRTVVGTADGCRVLDHVRVAGRIPWLTAALTPMYRLVFLWRHRRLRSRYGSA